MGRIAQVAKNIADQRIVIVGLARSGCAIAKALVQKGAQVLGSDRRTDIAQARRA